MTTRVAVLVGSLRADSVNRRLAEMLRDQAPAGVELRLVDGLGDLPFYNEEIDTDDAASAVLALRETVASADRVLAVTPEYNGTMPAVLNNALDWLSRPYGDTPGLGLFAGKWAALVAASPGGLGGIRALPLGQQLLANLSLTVLPQPLSLPKAGSAFNDSGALHDDATGQKLDALCQRLVDALAATHAQ